MYNQEGLLNKTKMRCMHSEENPTVPQILTPKNIAMHVESTARDIFSLRNEPLPSHFHDWNISNDYVTMLFELLNTNYQNKLPDEAVAFVRRYSDYTRKSIIEIGLETADTIRKEFQEIIERIPK